mmetsp:Transcript_7660/g.22457  ORF Transcript_7660/g.22457 Transcript_7660/m.22457 type:complete len:238 (-) Transcript_7660:441-1154(-)
MPPRRSSRSSKTADCGIRNATNKSRGCLPERPPTPEGASPRKNTPTLCDWARGSTITATGAAARAATPIEAAAAAVAATTTTMTTREIASTTKWEWRWSLTIPTRKMTTRTVPREPATSKTGLWWTLRRPSRRTTMTKTKTMAKAMAKPRENRGGVRRRNGKTAARPAATATATTTMMATRKNSCREETLGARKRDGDRNASSAFTKSTPIFFSDNSRDTWTTPPNPRDWQRKFWAC